MIMRIYMHVFDAPANGFLRFTIATGVFLSSIFLYSKHRRNCFSVFIVGMGPCLVYYVISYFEENRRTIIIAILIGVVLSSVYTTLHMSVQIKGNDIISQGKRRKRKRYVSLGFVSIIAVCLSATMALPIGEANIWSIGDETSQTQTKAVEIVSWDEEKTFDANIDTMVKLSDSIWPSVEEEEREEVIDQLMIIDCNYLGIPEVTIEYDDSMDEKHLGETCFETNTIRINRDLLEGKTSHRIVSTFFHEIYHVYQHRLVAMYQNVEAYDKNLLLLRNTNVEEWSREFNHYTSGDVDLKQYYNQSCEQDCRQYEKEGSEEVYRRIAEYLETRESYD